MGFFLIAIVLFVVGTVIEWFADAAAGRETAPSPGLLYLPVLPLAILTLPFKLVKRYM